MTSSGRVLHWQFHSFYQNTPIKEGQFPKEKGVLLPFTPFIHFTEVSKGPQYVKRAAALDSIGWKSPAAAALFS